MVALVDSAVFALWMARARTLSVCGRCWCSHICSCSTTCAWARVRNAFWPRATDGRRLGGPERPTAIRDRRLRRRGPCQCVVCKADADAHSQQAVDHAQDHVFARCRRRSRFGTTCGWRMFKLVARRPPAGRRQLRRRVAPSTVVFFSKADPHRDRLHAARRQRQRHRGRAPACVHVSVQGARQAGDARLRRLRRKATTSPHRIPLQALFVVWTSG
jgi:hypothetical protein